MYRARRERFLGHGFHSTSLRNQSEESSDAVRIGPPRKVNLNKCGSARFHRWTVTALPGPSAHRSTRGVEWDVAVWSDHRHSFPHHPQDVDSPQQQIGLMSEKAPPKRILVSPYCVFDASLVPGESGYWTSPVLEVRFSISVYPDGSQRSKH